MKLRIKGNSVRYRLSQSEVAQFNQNEYIEDCVDFLAGKLIYALQATKTIDSLQIDYSNNKITMFFPSTEIEKWTTTELVGYKNSIPLSNGSNMQLILEKDFVCLDDVEEDQGDNFPNPKSKC